MTKNAMFKLVVYSPKSHMDEMLEALQKNGCGTLGDGKYEGCAFLTFGHGTWIAQKGSKPFKGRLNRREMIQEVRVESTCPASKVDDVVKILRSVHPYEEPVIEVYPLEGLDSRVSVKPALQALRSK
ncbi:MAG: hypothetical protein FJY86_04155 [Candidatus Diapherotrites archaeon]|uniref:NGG1p interacting factor NIF3 n=1 Tax=Candidatus Iainarchaeum sp. TaxID=3101447 RepID=A0A8T4C7D0_9ARCH|nr:hypothetical protein [Candidatus Diapherotrites archaeon]